MKILLLAGNTLRARAYAYQLQKLSGDFYEISGLFYGFEEKQCFIPKIDKITKLFLEEQNLEYPNFNESIENTFEKNFWDFSKVYATDVNSDELIDAIGADDSKIIIFAGYGGQLLKKNHFNQNRIYLHMHPGKLPIERGSTTIYYSILNKRKLTVTAFFMTEKIDAGEDIIYSQYNTPKKGVNIDLWYDNVIRADCMVRALEAIKKGNDFQEQEGESNEYYIIHPVLKHLALLSLNQ